MSKSREGWNPYLLGGLSGLLMVWSLYYTGKYFGASTS
ncbi:MAG: YeeE/YedE family protein, partial [Synergistaceae bacterium]|nr:YeeE/YedE family protein [Synergistaceae bacterium]